MNKKLWQILAIFGVIILAFLVPVFITGTYTIHILVMVLIYVVLSSSLRFINLTGQLSLGHGGMMALGAYASALLVTRFEYSTWVTLLLGGVVAALLALIIGFPFGRLKGIYFAMITIFLAQVIRLVLKQWRDLTGGTTGFLGIPPLDGIHILGLNIDFVSRVDHYYFALVITIIILFILYYLEHSRIGIKFSALRQSDALAESVGINTAAYKVIALVIGCFCAGFIGAFYAHYIKVMRPDTFGFFFALYIMIYMVVGGQRKYVGPIIGAVILVILSEYLSGVKQYQPLIFATALLVIILFLPEGLVGLPGRFKKLFKSRKAIPGGQTGGQ